MGLIVVADDGFQKQPGENWGRLSGNDARANQRSITSSRSTFSAFVFTPPVQLFVEGFAGLFPIRLKHPRK